MRWRLSHAPKSVAATVQSERNAMPEIWVCLNVDESNVPEVHGLDMRDLYGRDADEILKKLGLKTLDEMHTETYEEWLYYRESIPEQFRKPWNADAEQWTPTSYGIEWADRLTQYLTSLSTFTDRWPYSESEVKLILETLSAFKAVMVKAKEHKADFRITYGT